MIFGVCKLELWAQVFLSFLITQCLGVFLSFFIRLCVVFRYWIGYGRTECNFMFFLGFGCLLVVLSSVCMFCVLIGKRNLCNILTFLNEQL